MLISFNPFSATPMCFLPLSCHLFRLNYPAKVSHREKGTTLAAECCRRLELNSLCPGHVMFLYCTSNYCRLWLCTLLRMSHKAPHATLCTFSLGEIVIYNVVFQGYVRILFRSIKFLSAAYWHYLHI